VVDTLADYCVAVGAVIDIGTGARGITSPDGHTLPSRGKRTPALCLLLHGSAVVFAPSWQPWLLSSCAVTRNATPALSVQALVMAWRTARPSPSASPTG
jgi:hypothetical protein